MGNIEESNAGRRDWAHKGRLQCEISSAGLKIAYYRKLRGLTQEELAERVDCTPAFIGHAKAPNICKAVSLDTLFAIADELDVPAYRFLMFDEE